jgi:hypothetical protein
MLRPLPADRQGVILAPGDVTEIEEAVLMRVRIGLWAGLVVLALLSGCLRPQGRGGTPEAPAPAPAPPARTPLYSSEQFRVFSQVPERVGDRLTLEGEAKVGGNSFIVVAEDGHYELVRQEVQLTGAGEWRPFTVTLALKEATSPNGMIYFTTPADAGKEPGLLIPVAFTAVGPKEAETGFRPVPRDRMHWGATGETPIEAAQRFVYGDGACDCQEQTARIVSQKEESVTVRVRADGLMDDSVKAGEVEVVLRQEGGVWKVESARERFECRRGVTAEGLCI